MLNLAEFSALIVRCFRKSVLFQFNALIGRIDRFRKYINDCMAKIFYFSENSIFEGNILIFVEFTDYFFEK